LKKIIELKPIQDVLKKKFPMFWHRRGRDFQLHAVSYTWENGTMRTRKAWEKTAETVADIQTFRHLNIDLYDAGATIDIGVLDKLIDSLYNTYRDEDGVLKPRPNNSWRNS